MTEFLAELYLPRTAAEAVDDARDRATTAAAELSAEGTSVRLDRTIFVPTDEQCLFLFEAPSIEAVRETARRAALSFEHIAEAVTDASREHGHEHDASSEARPHRNPIAPPRPGRPGSPMKEEYEMTNTAEAPA